MIQNLTRLASLINCISLLFGCLTAFTSLDDGGWYTDESKILATEGPCTIEVRDASSLSQDEFVEKYAYSKPVVIKGATDNTKFYDLCRKDYMLKNFGSKKIRLSSANTHSYEKADVSLKYYVENVMKPQTLEMLGNETFYWFGDNNYTEWEEVFSAYIPPPYRVPNLIGAYSFGLAGITNLAKLLTTEGIERGAGTGVPFHFHGPGFGEVIFGRKRWFMYQPSKMPHFHPNKTTLQWLYEYYPEIHESHRPLECTIRQGEMIYFPDHWWHGTLNIDTSVFISTFLSPL